MSVGPLVGGPELGGPELGGGGRFAGAGAEAALLGWLLGGD